MSNPLNIPDTDLPPWTWMKSLRSMNSVGGGIGCEGKYSEEGVVEKVDSEFNLDGYEEIRKREGMKR